MKNPSGYNNAFLKERAKGYELDFSLPLRIQKRDLLKGLGFPCDKNSRRCQVSDVQSIDFLLKTFEISGYPFVIIVSEWNMITSIPQLFMIRSSTDIIWRNHFGEKKLIKVGDLFEVIQRLNEKSWLEFARELWLPRVIAGRLIYQDIFVQHIEIQQGVKPAGLADNRQLPTFIGRLDDFKMLSLDYYEQVMALTTVGYQQIMGIDIVRRIAGTLRRHRDSFLNLSEIGNLPTLEFAFDIDNNQLIVIDIDWPEQWLQ